MSSRYRQWRARWGSQFHRPGIRLVAWLDAMIVDHGLLRPLWNTPSLISPGVWRSNHPSPRQLAKLQQQGLTTVVSLRGLGSGGSSLFEIEACDRLGLTLVDLNMSSRGVPQRDQVLNILRAFENLKTPMLLHCKSGADRSGFVSALYLLGVRGEPIEFAKSQLSWRYLHFRTAKTGMLYAFLCEYEAFNAQQPIDLLTWVQEYYDPEALRHSFKPRGFSSWMVDKVLRRE